MIIIQVEVPALGTRYDFQIDEDTPMHEVQSEIIDMICQRNSCGLLGDRERFLMWNKDTGAPIQREAGAYANGLRTGSTLILA